MKRWIAALFALLGCGDNTLPPRGQVLLYFDTNAPVPALFDALSVDVYRPGETTPCDTCSRTFVLSESRFSDPLGVSIGIVIPPNTRGWVVRARLYSSSSTLFAEPPEPIDGVTPQSAIDIYASLPPIQDTGIVERSISFDVADLGSPRGTLDAPVDTQAGRIAITHVGSWEGARAVPCKGTARADEVCVPGGAFWMGNPHVADRGFQGVPTSEAIGGASNARRLVVLSPFFMKRTEVTVGEVRQSSVAASLTTPWTGSSSGNASNDYCTFTAAPGKHDDLPVNCITRAGAAAFCKDWGGELPTEAQFEYVASALSGSLFPWGSDDPTCDTACFSRSGRGIFSNAVARCMAYGPPPGGPESVRTIRLDHVTLNGADIVDLAGNVSEFVLDTWNRQDEPCWNQPGVMVDPLCTTPGADGPAWSIRGGNWAQSGLRLAAAGRYAITQNASANSNVVGFRCARPDN
jgi:sulfatase modifying factor 1